MRKIIAMEFYSLDGFMSDPEDKQDWVTENFSFEMGEHIDRIFEESDTLFLGAVTYKIMASYWPSAGSNPNAYEGDAEFAATMNNMKKIVFSKNPPALEWENTEFRSEINPHEIRNMKEASGKNILIQGSASIVQQLTNLGLIDEYHLLVHPVILAEGKPLFNEIKQRQNLKLVEAKPFENGAVLLHYQPA